MAKSLSKHQWFPLPSGGRQSGMLKAQAWGRLIPAFLAGHRDCRWTRAPRFAISLAANQASWGSPKSYCWDRWQESGRRCSFEAGLRDTLAGGAGTPDPPTLLGGLLPILGASTTEVAFWAGGPRLTRTSPHQGKEEEASGWASHSLRGSGTGAGPGCGLAARQCPARWRRGPGTHWGAAGHTLGVSVGCIGGTQACVAGTQRWGARSESSERPECCCPVLCGSPATGADLRTCSLGKGSKAPGGGSFSPRCLHGNLHGRRQAR